MMVPVALALFGPPWYAEIRRQFARQAGELADDDRPGEGYLVKAGHTSPARVITLVPRRSGLPSCYVRCATWLVSAG